MSDTPETPPAGGAGPDGGTQAKPSGPPLQINAQYIKDLSFENPNAPQVLVQRGQPPQVNVNVDVRSNALGSGTYEVILHLGCDAKLGDMQAFLIELDYGGIVTIAPEVNQQQAALLLSIEAPRFLFPFARAIISEAVRDGGFLSFHMQPIDFVALFQRQMKALQERMQTSGGATEGEADTPTVN